MAFCTSSAGMTRFSGSGARGTDGLILFPADILTSPLLLTDIFTSGCMIMSMLSLRIGAAHSWHTHSEGRAFGTATVTGGTVPILSELPTNAVRDEGIPYRSDSLTMSCSSQSWSTWLLFSGYRVLSGCGTGYPTFSRRLTSSSSAYPAFRRYSRVRRRPAPKTTFSEMHRSRSPGCAVATAIGTPSALPRVSTGAAEEPGIREQRNTGVSGRRSPISTASIPDLEKTR